MTTVIERRVHRRGTAAAWTAANPVLLAGEVGYETDTHKTKLGDGATNWVTLPYDAPNATVLSSTYVSIAKRAAVVPNKWQTDRFITDAFAPPPAADLPVVTTTTTGSVYTWTIATPVSRNALRIGGTGAWDTTDTHFRVWGEPNGAAPNGNEPFLGGGTIKPGGLAQIARWQNGFEFTTNSDAVEILTRNAVANSGIGAIRVNGRWLSEAQLAGTVPAGNWLFTKLTFPAAAPRTITVYLTQACGFSYVSVKPGHDVMRPPNPPKRRIAFVGDSHVNGSGSAPGGTEALETFALRLGYLLGADETILAGIGGTRWVPASSGTADVLASHFGGRLTDVLAMNPSVIVFAGSVNDGGQAAADITAAVTTALGLCTAVPEVYVSGPPTFTNATINNAVKAGALAAGRPFIDLAGIIYGTGKVGATTGDGNADYFMGTDGVHPTHDGHKAIARAFYEAIAGQFGMS